MEACLGHALPAVKEELVMKSIQIESESLLKCWCGLFCLVLKDVAISFCLRWVTGENVSLNLKLTFFYFLKGTAVFGRCSRGGGGVAARG